MNSEELYKILNKTRRTPNISLTPEQVEELVKDLEILEILKEECQEGIDQYGKGTWGWVEFNLGYEDELDADGTNKMKKLREWLKHGKQRNDK